MNTPEETLGSVVENAAARLRRSIERLGDDWPFGPLGNMPGPEQFLLTALAWAAFQLDFDVYPEVSYRTSGTAERIDLLLRSNGGASFGIELKMIGGLGSPAVEALEGDAEKLRGFDPGMPHFRICYRGIIVGSWNALLTGWWQESAASGEAINPLAEVCPALASSYHLEKPVLVWSDPADQSFHLLVARLKH